MELGTGSGSTTRTVITTLSRTSDSLSEVLSRLSSGLRVVVASDDAAALALSTTQKNESRLYGQAQLNINDAVSYLNIAESGIDAQKNILLRMQEIALQAEQTVVDLEDIQEVENGPLDNEYRSLLTEYYRIKDSLEFNGESVFNSGSLGYAPGRAVQVGVDGSSSSAINIGDLNLAADVRSDATYNIDLTKVNGWANGMARVFDILNSPAPKPFSGPETTEAVKTYLDTEQVYQLTADGGTKNILLAPIAVEFGTVHFIALVETAPGSQLWTTTISPVDALVMINVANSSVGESTIVRSLTFDSNGVVTTDNLSGLAIDSGSTVILDAIPSATFTASIFGGQSLIITNSINNAKAFLSTQIDKLEISQGMIAAQKSRLSISLDYVQQMKELTGASAERIVEADSAADLAEYAKAQILLSSGIALLASANQSPLTVYELLIEN